MDGALLIEQHNFCRLRSCVCAYVRLYVPFPRVTNAFSRAIPVAQGLTVTQMCKGLFVRARVDMILTSRCGGMHEESMVYP